jgi:hypothetical protein
MRSETMKVLRKLLNDTDGQGLVEYTLIVFLVAFVFLGGDKRHDCWHCDGRRVEQSFRLRRGPIFMRFGI